jgi:hypothetical protein
VADVASRQHIRREA